MTTVYGKTMLASLKKILAAHNLTDKFEGSEDFYAKIESSGYTPLTLEKHESYVTVTHYCEKDGALLLDPDMSFFLHDRLGLIPFTIQYSDGSHRITLPTTGDAQRFADHRELNSQNLFANKWGRNLIDQGFADLACSTVVHVDSAQTEMEFI